MTTIAAGPDRSTWWPIPSRQHHYADAVKTMASYLIGAPTKYTGQPDANVTTHRQVRCDGEAGVRVHRVTLRERYEYVTGCGIRVAKTRGVLTAASVDCGKDGCR